MKIQKTILNALALSMIVAVASPMLAVGATRHEAFNKRTEALKKTMVYGSLLVLYVGGAGILYYAKPEIMTGMKNFGSAAKDAIVNGAQTVGTKISNNPKTSAAVALGLVTVAGLRGAFKELFGILMWGLGIL